MPSILNVDPEYHRGLLCQAKIKRRASRKCKSEWGGFASDNQRAVLRTRLNDLSLLLYEYTDADRHLLAPFGWQLCGGAQFEDVEQWLKSGQFPDRQTSDKIIALLLPGVSLHGKTPL